MCPLRSAAGPQLANVSAVASLRILIERFSFAFAGPFACIQALSLLLPAPARAGEAADGSVEPGPTVAERRHRVSFSLGYAAVDGNKDIEGDHRIARNAGNLRAGYAYRPLAWFEAGADLAYWTTATSSAIQAAIPSLVIRPFVPIGEHVEIGLSGRVGAVLWPQTDAGTGVWIGPAFSAGPDVRVWITDVVGLTLGGDVTAAHGTGPGIMNAVSERAWFFAGGAFFGAAARF